MLLLLKPWKNEKTDLKSPNETWKSAYDTFMSTATSRTKNIVEGIQFFHSCKHAAQKAQEDEGYHAIEAAERKARIDEDLDELVDLQNEDDKQVGGLQMSKAGLEILKASLQPIGEDNWGHAAVMVAQNCGLLPKDGKKEWKIKPDSHKVGNATDEDLQKLIQWQKAMDLKASLQIIGGTEEGNNEDDSDDELGNQFEQQSRKSQPHVEMLKPDLHSRKKNGLVEPEADSEESLPGLDISELRIDQQRAFEIVAWHLGQTLG